MTPRKVNLFETFRRAMMSNPDASRKEAFDAFLSEVQSDPRYLTALAEDYFYREAAKWQPTKTGICTTLTATPTHAARIEKTQAQRVERQEQISQRVARIVREVQLLSLMLPNGKLVRHATGAEMAKAGSWYATVAKRMKPSEVVDKKFTEQDLQNIYSRFERNRNRSVASESRLSA